MVSFGGAACWLYLFPMALPINSCMPDYTQHYCTFQCGDTKTYENIYIEIHMKYLKKLKDQFVYARLHTTLLHLPMRGHEKIWHNIHIKIQICIKVHICIKIYMKNIIYVSKFIRKRLWKLRDCWLTYSIPQSWIGVTWNKELLKKTMHILLRYISMILVNIRNI